MRYSVAGMVCAVWLGGCVLSMHPAGVGQMAGSVIGSAVAPGPGTQLGGLIGMLAGQVVQQEIDKQAEAQERADLDQRLRSGESIPAPSVIASDGIPTRVWVDEVLRSGQVRPGHFEEWSLL